MNRRELLTAAAAVLAGANTPEPLARLLDGLTSPEVPAGVGQSQIEAVRQAADAYTALDLRYGGGVAADVSSGALRWSVRLLDAPMRDDIRTELSTAVGALAARTAWTHFDAGRAYSARRLSTLALRASDAGGDANVRGHVMVDMAAQIGDDEPAAAAGVVDSALSDRRVCVVERAILHAALARHLAKAGDKRQALHHIATAETLAGRGGHTPEWLSMITVEHLNSVVTEALVAAGEDREAIQRIETLLTRLGPDRSRLRVNKTITLADLYARTGRLDEARAVADQAEAALTNVRSARTTAALTTLRQRVARAAH